MSKTINFGNIILITIIGLMSLTISYNMNTINPKIIIGFLLLSLFVLIFFTIKPITIRNALILSCLFFIKPFYSTIYFALIIIILSSIIQKKDSSKLATFPYLFYFIILIISTFIGLSKAYIFSEGLFYSLSSTFIPLLLLAIIINSDIDHTDILIILKTYVGVASLVAFLGIALALRNPNERIGSLWITAMTINAFYMIAFFLSIAIGLDSKTKKNKILFLILSIVIFLGILSTYTRMALLATIFGIIIMMLRVKQFRKYSVFLLLLIPLIIPASLHERLNRNITEDLSMLYRFAAWFQSIKMIKSNFWFGIGINNFIHIYPRYVPSQSMILIHPHNIILRYWLELGFLGLLSYFAIIISIISKFVKFLKNHTENYLYQAMLICVLVILFACITDVFISQIYIAVIFWMILAFMEKIMQLGKNSYSDLLRGISDLIIWTAPVLPATSEVPVIFSTRGIRPENRIF